MFDIAAYHDLERLLSGLAEQLEAAGHAYEPVVVGGSALLALGLLSRPTQDIGIVALRTGNRLVKAAPLPPALVAARDRVARDFGVQAEWLNAGPADLLDLGLPEGFRDRLRSRSYGSALTVHFASRLDQIHLKLYALADRGPGKHEADLRRLEPTAGELLLAARWTRTHDPSPGFREMLAQALELLGVKDADLGA